MSHVFWDTLQPLQFPVLFERERRKTANPRKGEFPWESEGWSVRRQHVCQYVCLSLWLCRVS
jgi:hypothetical protein